MKTPAVVIRPIEFELCSVNHSAPSAPAAIEIPLAPGNSVATPAVVILPILSDPPAQYQRFPSGPAVMPPG